MRCSMEQDSTRIDANAGTGRRLVVGLLMLGLGLACFAIWFQWQQTRRCLAFYGSDSARLIQAAPRVELWEPAAAPATAQSAARTDVSHAPGLVHLRRGLVEDANFDWQRAAGGDAAWDAAFAFYDTAAATTPARIKRTRVLTSARTRCSIFRRPAGTFVGVFMVSVADGWRSGSGSQAIRCRRGSPRVPRRT